MLTQRPRNQLLHSVEIFHDAGVTFVVLHIGARFTVEMLYDGIMLVLLWKCCMLCVLGLLLKCCINLYGFMLGLLLKCCIDLYGLMLGLLLKCCMYSGLEPRDGT